MDQESFDAERIKAFWLVEAEESLQVAEHLVEKGDNSYALFFGHLAIEKALKAYYVAQRHEHAPPTHNLVRLARAAALDLDDKKTEALSTITGFNIETRYPDFKRAFREKCTSDYTRQQMGAIKEVFQWLRSQLP